MIYEVCALVLTIILGVIGIELMLWFHSVRKLTDEAKKTVENINAHLPSMLADAQAVTALVRNTGEQIGGTVNEVAVSIENFRKNPLSVVTVLIHNVKQVIELWHSIRGRKMDTPESKKEY